ncbi:dnaJ ERDJ2A-like [Olea europaea subsp. europaea]|uniref:DnaJ ERDJ2A-like n=2 Tax=Olea europaea subsp. europaea TaxID=158383 RepID=A0A8S0TE66_OLEEU|nr:dnaJ ERDJ2A-like [Olea europaea subsp. europaea]
MNAAVKEAIDRVKAGSRLVMSKFQAPAEGNHNVTSYCLCDSWIGCDAKSTIKLKVLKGSRAGDGGMVAAEELPALEDEGDEVEEEDEYDDDYESEYSEDDEDVKGKDANGSVANGFAHVRGGDNSSSDGSGSENN